MAPNSIRRAPARRFARPSLWCRQSAPGASNRVGIVTDLSHFFCLRVQTKSCTNEIYREGAPGHRRLIRGLDCHGAGARRWKKPQRVSLAWERENEKFPTNSSRAVDTLLQAEAKSRDHPRPSPLLLNTQHLFTYRRFMEQEIVEQRRARGVSPRGYPDAGEGTGRDRSGKRASA